jgi:hypothetical protein
VIRNDHDVQIMMTRERDIKNQRKRHMVIGLKEEKVKGDERIKSCASVEMGNNEL